MMFSLPITITFTLQCQFGSHPLSEDFSNLPQDFGDTSSPEMLEQSFSTLLTSPWLYRLIHYLFLEYLYLVSTHQMV